MFDHGAHFVERGQPGGVPIWVPSPISLVSVQLKAGTSKASALTDGERKELIERVRAGEHVELDIAAETFRHTVGQPIRGAFEMSPRAIQQLRQTATDNPIQRNHDLHGETKGRVLSAELLGTTSDRTLRETIRLVKPDAVIGALDGTDGQYSIGFVPLEEMDSILCTHCGKPALQVGHYPGQILDTKNGPVKATWRYTNVRKRETSITAFPQILQTRTTSVSRSLSAVPRTYTEVIRMELSELATMLGCAPTENAIRERIGAMKTGEALAADHVEKGAKLQADLDQSRARAVELEVTANKSQSAALMASMRAGGMLAPGSKTEARALALVESGNVAGLQQLNDILSESGPAVPTGQRQSVNAQGADRAGNGAPAPRTDTGAIDFDKMALSLSDKTRGEYASAVKVSSWRAVFSVQAADHLWSEAGHKREAN